MEDAWASINVWAIENEGTPDIELVGVCAGAKLIIRLLVFLSLLIQNGIEIDIQRPSSNLYVVSLVVENYGKVAQDEVEVFLVQEFKQFFEVWFFQNSLTEVKCLVFERIVLKLNRCTLNIVNLAAVVYHERYAVFEQRVKRWKRV